MPSSGIAGHMVILFLAFWGTSILFSIVAVSIYIPKVGLNRRSTLNFEKIQDIYQRKFYFPEKDNHINGHINSLTFFPIAPCLKYLVYPSVACQWNVQYLSPLHIYITIAFNNFYFGGYFLK